MNSDTASTYSVDQKFDNKPETPPSPYLNVIRIIQYIFSTIALVFVACAIDRNILVPGVTTEEIVLCASVSAQDTAAMLRPTRANAVLVYHGSARRIL